jgi:UDP-glucose 4-epimerase
MKILVTGGAGYIGSHTCVLLQEAGHDLVVVDNLGNSTSAVIGRIEAISGRAVQFVEGDIRDGALIRRVLDRGVEAVVHFAALKSVGESCAAPLTYFDNNIGGTITLLRAMDERGVTRLVFSSSATVYGDQEVVPVSEDAKLSVTNPYGRTKLVMEELIQDWCAANSAVSAIILRYFNPAGAHLSGRLGEDPRGVPNNLIPYVSQVAAGKLKRLRVFGGDYPTRDGTGVRDYIHVMDLAAAHLRAVAYASECQGCEIFNLGTGHGFSVLEIISMFERVSGKPVPFDLVDRRKGDVATLTANPAKAETILGWRRKFDLEDICRDAWQWQQAQAGDGDAH